MDMWDLELVIVIVAINSIPTVIWSKYHMAGKSCDRHLQPSVLVSNKQNQGRSKQDIANGDHMMLSLMAMMSTWTAITAVVSWCGHTTLCLAMELPLLRENYLYIVVLCCPVMVNHSKLMSYWWANFSWALCLSRELMDLLGLLKILWMGLTDLWDL